MALKAVFATDVPCLDQVPEGPALSSASPTAAASAAPVRVPVGRQWHLGGEPGKFVVVGHRGKGMNALASTDRRLRAVKENTIRSFHQAAMLPVDFVEFDVQVTRDGVPIVFHDNFIFTEENGAITERRVTDLCLEEFLSCGPQRDSNQIGKPLHRKLKDGRVVTWNVEEDDAFCTLEEVFRQVNPRIGFNVELKFDDHVMYTEQELTTCLQHILRVVFDCGNGRPILFSSFQPDAAKLMRKLQTNYPVFFLTNGGNEIYKDPRRNSLEEAIKWALENGLQGIVSEVRGVFRNPALIPVIKEANLSLLTYGQLNNVSEAVYMQHLMGVDGVIVDLVQEITEAVSDLIVEESQMVAGGGDSRVPVKPNFSQSELNFLLKLIPQLVQH